MGLFGALNKALSSPTLGGITNGLVQDRRRAFAQNQYDEQKNREQAERDFASEFNKSIVNGDIDSATMLFDQFQGQLSPQTADSARREIQQIKSTQQANQIKSATQDLSGGMTPIGAKEQYGLDVLKQAQPGAEKIYQTKQDDQLKREADAVDLSIKKQTLMQKLAEAKKMQDGGSEATPTAPKISTTTQQKIDSLLSVNDEAANLIKQLDNPKLQEYLGPYAGRIANISNSMGAGDLPDEVVNFRSGLYDMVDLWLRERTGAAVTADEVERAMTEIIGGPTTNPNALRTRLKRMAESNAQRINRLSQGTIGVDKPDEVLARDGSSEGPKFNPQTGRYE